MIGPTETDRQVQIRAKMVDLLFEIDRRPAQRERSSVLGEDPQTYGLLLAWICSLPLIWFVGKAGNELIALLALQGMLMGSLVALFGRLSLATKLDRFGQRFRHYIGKLADDLRDRR